jgi:orotidine-5'-phosphate decarboxylase
MVALDNFSSKEDCLTFLKQLPSELPIVKIGLEMFYRFGRDFVTQVHQDFGKKIFLDLKLHDIPNTASKSMKALENLPIEFLTVHLSGGEEMLKACQKVRNDYMESVNILGVSYLTSLDQSDFKALYGITSAQIPNYFTNLFQLASQTKTQGIVCSAAELDLLKDFPELLKVCPGIRFQDEIESGKIGDQKRVLSPSQAFANGASYLVMGRSLTTSHDLQARVSELNS